MKTVIVEIRKNKAAALTDDGCVIKVKDRNYAIGEVIKVGKLQKINKPKFAIIATCAAALAIVFGISTWAYFTPYTYVSLDVNPSVEFEVNRFDRVLSVTAVNDDGSEILQDIDVNNMTIDDALKTTVNEIEQEGYFDGQNPGGIMISTSSENEEQAQSLAEELENTAEEVIIDKGESIEIEAVSVGLQRVREAHALGTTPGKLNLIQKMQASSANPNEINVEEWLNKPVKDIMKVVNQNRNKEKLNVKQQNQNSVNSSESGEAVEDENSSLPNQNSSSDAIETFMDNKSDKSENTKSSNSSKTAGKSKTSNNGNGNKNQHKVNNNAVKSNNGKNQ